MSKIAIHYMLSESARRRIGDDTGDVPPVEDWLIVDLVALDAGDRARILGGPIVPIGASTLYYLNRYVAIPDVAEKLRAQGVTHWAAIHSIDTSSVFSKPPFSIESRGAIELDHIPAIADVIAHLERMATETREMPERAKLEWLLSVPEKCADAIARDDTSTMYVADWKIMPAGDVLEKALVAYQGYCAWRAKRVEEKDVAQIAVVAAQQAREDLAHSEAEAKRIAGQAARLGWARQFGSDHLRRSLEAGHTCSRLYWIERAKIEYPLYTLDFNRTAVWKERSCPTLRALDARDAILAEHPDVTATIVWLTSAPTDNVSDAENDECDGYEFEVGEALVVDDPTYEHNLLETL